MPVDSLHPDYEKMLPEWQLVLAATRGQREVKALGRAVLPPIGRGDEDKESYKNYLMRAVYTNFTGRTQAGLVGAAFRRDLKSDLPSSLQYLESDADGNGQSIAQYAKRVLSTLMSTGREILLTDYPQVEYGLTQEEIVKIDAKAYIKHYSAMSCINWKTGTFGGVNKLTLVVLKENINASGEEFGHDMSCQYRVLRLTDGIYTQQVYSDVEGKLVGGEVITPRKADGSAWDCIPIVFIGGQSNDVAVDDIPLADIAHVNLAHFRNSADLEENCMIHGQLTLGIASSLSYEQFEKANPNGIAVGSKSGHFLGDNGSFTSVQADPNQLADKLMERKEDQMRKLGAKMIEQRSGNQTAEAARIDAAGEGSVLSDLVSNVEAAFNLSIGWCGEFMGESVEEPLEFNRSFFDESVDPQMIIAAMQLSDRGVIANKDLLALSRKAGVVDPDRTDEEIEGEAEAQDPIGIEIVS